MNATHIKTPTNKAEYLNLLKECLAATKELSKTVEINSDLLSQMNSKAA